MSETEDSVLAALRDAVMEAVSSGRGRLDSDDFGESEHAFENYYWPKVEEAILPLLADAEKRGYLRGLAEAEEIIARHWDMTLE